MQSPPVVIVDEALAAKFWPDGAIGKRLRRAVPMAHGAR